MVTAGAALSRRSLAHAQISGSKSWKTACKHPRAARAMTSRGRVPRPRRVSWQLRRQGSRQNAGRSASRRLIRRPRFGGPRADRHQCVRGGLFVRGGGLGLRGDACVGELAGAACRSVRSAGARGAGFSRPQRQRHRARRATAIGRRTPWPRVMISSSMFKRPAHAWPGQIAAEISIDVMTRRNTESA